MKATAATEPNRLKMRLTQPLLKAIEVLAPHFEEIATAWHGQLKNLCQNRNEFQALANLNPQSLFENLSKIKVSGFKQSLIHQGETLAALDVPLEHAIIASILYLELCLPHLISEDDHDEALAPALARLNSAGRLFLISGYTNQRKASLQRLEQNLGEAEEHVQGLSRIIIDVYDKERRRISRDLHDEVGHDLIVLKLYLEMIERDMSEGSASQVAKKLTEAITLVAKAIERVRSLAFDLGPAISDELGFVPALRMYARQFAARTGIQVSVQARRLSAKLPSTYEMTLYRVLQGALSNVIKHARASKVRITLASGRESVIMVVEDDGIGFDVPGKRGAQAFGLRTMRERMELLGGQFQIESRRSRFGKGMRGTRIEARLPLLVVETK